MINSIRVDNYHLIIRSISDRYILSSTEEILLPENIVRKLLFQAFCVTETKVSLNDGRLKVVHAMIFLVLLFGKLDNDEEKKSLLQCSLFSPIIYT